MSLSSSMSHLNSQIDYNTSYQSFLPAENHSPTQTEMDDIQLGQGIQKKYETGREYTPGQKCKIAIITALAIVAILAIGAIVFGAMVSMGPLAWAAGVVLVLTLASGALYLSFRKPDLNLPSERAVEVHRLALLPLTEIAKQYSVKTIRDYRLLDGVSLSNPSEITRKAFYVEFERLAKAFHSVQKQHAAHEREISLEYHYATAPERQAYNREVNQVYSRIAVTDSIAVISHIGDRPRRRYRPNVFDFVASSNRMAGSMEVYDARNRLERSLDNKRGPRDNALNSANLAYRSALTKLDAMYQSNRTKVLNVVPSSYDPTYGEPEALIIPGGISVTPLNTAFVPLEMQAFVGGPPPPYSPVSPSAPPRD